MRLMSPVSMKRNPWYRIENTLARRGIWYLVWFSYP